MSLTEKLKAISRATCAPVLLFCGIAGAGVYASTYIDRPENKPDPPANAASYHSNFGDYGVLIEFRGCGIPLLCPDNYLFTDTLPDTSKGMMCLTGPGLEYVPHGQDIVREAGYCLPVGLGNAVVHPKNN